MRKFRDILSESKGQIVFTFGRFNPPTTGHEKLMDKVSSVAGSNPYRIYPSQTQNPKKDPLPYSLKVAYMRKMFPKHRRNIIASKNGRTAIEIAEMLYKEGFTDLIMVVGSDRVTEFSTLLNRYNDAPDKKGNQLFKFDSIDVISAGERDPDAEGVEGMSASKMRAAATAGDFDSFKTGLPSGFRDALKLYNDVRKYMGIREERDMGDMNDFETLRDLYLTGKLWNVGDLVEANGVKGKVIRKGTNYLSFVDENNKVHKTWLHDIDIEEQKKITKVKQAKGEVGDVKGTQPAKYYAKGAGGKGMKKSTKLARARFFAKGKDKPDDDPASYKPAPGDKGKKTKPSQYTLKYKKMYGERKLTGTEKEKLKDLEKKVPKKDFTDRYGKEGEAIYYATLTKMAKNEEVDMEFYRLDEKIQGLVNKSKQTGVPYSILKKSYDRGMAAWKTGHRPGTTPQQWAMARVNSMLTGGKADPDLQPKARAAKKKKKAAKKSEQFSSVQEWFESNQTRASYQLKHGDDWWWKLNEVHDKMLEKTGECCDDCSEELDEVSMSKALDIDPKDVDRMKTLAVLYTRAMKLPAGSPKQDKFKKEIEKLRKELRMDESVFQELVKSIELGEQPEHEITVGNYTTKFFYMCGSAQKVMKANANVEGAEELTRMQDNFYKLEKEAMDAGEASEEQKKQAVDLYNRIMKKAGEIGLADDIDDYMKMHIDSVIKGKPKLGFGRTDIKESLWANIHKKRQRIKRGSGERMRKKGEKGAPTPAQMKRAKGENTLLKFNQVELKNVWGEVTEAAEYQGRKVQLNNPTRGDVKKFKVYVKNDKGNVVKVEFGDPNMEIKRDDPARRKNFRARHNCDNPGPKYKARYWSCKFWEKGKSVTDLMKG